MNARSDRNLQLATIDPDPHVLDQVIIRTDFDIAGLVGKQDLHSARSIDGMKVSDRHGAGYQISASLDPGLTEDTAPHAVVPNRTAIIANRAIINFSSFSVF